MKFNPESLPDLTGKVYVVTGGTSGIGYHTCRHLARKGAHVYVCARNPTKGAATIKSIKDLHPSAKITLLEIDHVSLSSVVTAAKTVLSNETRLDGLVNNAGIMMTPLEITKDGYEMQWQTNYLAHWVLTSHLLPLLAETAKGLPAGSVRIVNLTSSGHWSAPKGGINFQDTTLESAKDNSNLNRYGQSKLANVLHAKTLHQQYGPGSPHAMAGNGEIWVSAVHPGLVKTNLADAAVIPGPFQAFLSLFGPLVYADTDTGSWTSLFCAASDIMSAEQSGTYFQRVAEPGCQSGNAKDFELAKKLEAYTVKEMETAGWTSQKVSSSVPA